MNRQEQDSLLQEIEETSPLWQEFIEGIGYSKQKAKKFAKGYAAKLKLMSYKNAIQALNEQNEECMLAGFKEARISINSAFKKFQSLLK